MHPDRACCDSAVLVIVFVGHYSVLSEESALSRFEKTIPYSSSCVTAYLFALRIGVTLMYVAALQLFLASLSAAVHNKLCDRNLVGHRIRTPPPVRVLFWSTHISDPQQ